MYGVPFFAGEIIIAESEFASNYSTPYPILFSDEPDDFAYNLYVSLGPVQAHVNPDTVTEDMIFLVSFAAPDTLYGSLQGTSMSAPQVTGVAALLSAENPDWTPREIRRVIKATARDVGKTTYHGHGMVDPVAALEVDDPAEVRDQLDQPEDRDDRGRNESGGGSPRNSSGGSGGSNRGRSRGDDDDDNHGRSR
jgi:subtilisin family serine protease